MEALKNNSYLKWTYYYFYTAYILVPVLVVILYGIRIYKMIGAGSFDAVELDLFSIFGQYEFDLNSYGSALSLIIISTNMFFFFLIYFFLKKLVAFLKNVRTGKPLIFENSVLLTQIGTIIIFISFLLHSGDEYSRLLSHPTKMPVAAYLLVNSINNVLTYILNPFLYVGLLVIIIGKIFYEGSVLKQENELTV